LELDNSLKGINESALGNALCAKTKNRQSPVRAVMKVCESKSCRPFWADILMAAYHRALPCVIISLPFRQKNQIL